MTVAWTKSSPAIVALFDRSVPDDPRVVRRQMFGYPAAFANGNLFISLFEDEFVIRLSPQDMAAFAAAYGARPFAPMAGRTMRGYALLPPALLDDAPARTDWIGRALAHALSLPAKARTKARARLSPAGA